MSYVEILLRASSRTVRETSAKLVLKEIMRRERSLCRWRIRNVSRLRRAVSLEFDSSVTAGRDLVGFLHFEFHSRQSRWEVLPLSTTSPTVLRVLSK